jgi:hypothetical protein
MITFATPTGPAGTPKRTTDAARWIVHVILAAQFVVAGAGRIPDCCRALSDHLSTVGSVLGMQLAGGALEPAGAVGLAVPCLFAAAALGLLGAVAIASLAHLIGLLASADCPFRRSR